MGGGSLEPGDRLACGLSLQAVTDSRQDPRWSRPANSYVRIQYAYKLNVTYTLRQRQEVTTKDAEEPGRARYQRHSCC